MDARSFFYSYCDILALRPVEPAVVKAVPKPKGAIIKNGLPSWNTRSLDAKLPLITGPDGPIIFSRGKLGVGLWKNDKYTDFLLYDPYGYEVSFSYEPLHDKHLKKWLNNSTNKEHLLQLGLVTEGMDVKCSVKQCNDYRKYLKRIHNIGIIKEVIRLENETRERLQMKKGREILHKEMMKLNKKRDEEEKRNENLKKLIHDAELKKQDCNRRLKRINERTAYMEKKKKNDLKKSIERRRAKDEHIQNKIKAANKIERNRKIQTLRKWRDNDLEKKKKFDQECQEKEKLRAMKAKEKWVKKVENQVKDLEKEEFLRRQRKAQLEASRRVRMKDMRSRQARLQEKIFLHQGQTVVKNVTIKFKSKQKNILHSIRDKYFNEMKIRYAEDVETLKTLKDKIQHTLANIRFDLEPYALITEAKRRLNYEVVVPEPVVFVINWCIDGAIMISVAKRLEQTMYKISHSILTSIDKIKFPVDSKSKLSAKKGQSFYLPSANLVDIIAEKEARVSFGNMGIYLKDISGLSALKSSKTRRPTPIPAAEAIINVAYEDPDIEHTSDNVFDEQKKLMRDIDDVSEWLLKNIDRRVQVVIQISKSLKVQPQQVSPLNPLVRLCNLIMFTPKDDFISVLDTIILDIFQTLHIKPSSFEFVKPKTTKKQK